MRKFARALLCCLIGGLAPAWGFSRVVSLNLCTDQLLIALAPEKIAALSILSRDPALSLLRGDYKIVPADAEAVLALHPDLILSAAFGATATVGLLKKSGLPVWQTAMPQDFAGIAAETRALGALLGVPDRAEALIAVMNRNLDVPPADRGSALILEPRLYLDGGGTLGDAVLRAAGFHNQANLFKTDLETLASHPPDLLISVAQPQFPSLATDLLIHPALIHLRRRTIDGRLLLCAGPWSAEAVRELALP